LVRGENIVLETSYSERKGDSLSREISPIQNDPYTGLTGYMAFHKKSFNLRGEELRKLKSKAKTDPADFYNHKNIFRTRSPNARSRRQLDWAAYRV
jgi:hypothetical protein